MIEMALKSSRDYYEKWWRLLRKVVAITAKNGVVRGYAHSLCPIIPTQKVGPCIAKPTFFSCFPDTVLLSLQAICRYLPSPFAFFLSKRLGRCGLLGNASCHGIGHFGTQTHHIGFVNGVDCVGKKDDGEVVLGVNHNRSARISRVTEGGIAQ